ncbi:MAG: DUF366 family protein [Candidatus Sericytochromatia bacterium]|nr:DUF366 family protein [Candidatus Sericytochromatia bacterium]
MQHFLLEERQSYTGHALRSHWIYQQTGQSGDAIIAFHGSCDVRLSEMVDLADVQENAPIYSENMLHFLIEHFQVPLDSMILRQRLFTSILQDLLRKAGCQNLRRSGDDLFDGEAKLSVSIATVSPVSGLIHLGLNISSHNTPVPTIGLADYGLEWKDVARQALQAYCGEMQEVKKALVKVRWVH